MNTSTVTWIDASKEKPKEDKDGNAPDVLLFNPNWSDKVAIGSYEGHFWEDNNGVRLWEDAGDVPTHWANLPKGPE